MPLLLPGDATPLYLCSVIHPHTSLSINLVVTVSIPDWQLRLAALHWPLLFRLLSHKKLFKIPESSHLFHVPLDIIIGIACRLPLFKVYSIGRWFNNKTSAFLSIPPVMLFFMCELRSAKHIPIQFPKSTHSVSYRLSGVMYTNEVLFSFDGVHRSWH